MLGIQLEFIILLFGTEENTSCHFSCSLVGAMCFGSGQRSATKPMSDCPCFSLSCSWGYVKKKTPGRQNHRQKEPRSLNRHWRKILSRAVQPAPNFKLMKAICIVLSQRYWGRCVNAAGQHCHSSFCDSKNLLSAWKDHSISIHKYVNQNFFQICIRSSRCDFRRAERQESKNTNTVSYCLWQNYLKMDGKQQ